MNSKNKLKRLNNISDALRIAQGEVLKKDEPIPPATEFCINYANKQKNLKIISANEQYKLFKILYNAQKEYDRKLPYMKWWESAAENNDPQALYHFMLFNIDKRDYNKAYEYFIKLQHAKSNSSYLIHATHKIHKIMELRQLDEPYQKDINELKSICSNQIKELCAIRDAEFERLKDDNFNADNHPKLADINQTIAAIKVMKTALNSQEEFSAYKKLVAFKQAFENQKLSSYVKYNRDQFIAKVQSFFKVIFNVKSHTKADKDSIVLPANAIKSMSFFKQVHSDNTQPNNNHNASSKKPGK